MVYWKHYHTPATVDEAIQLLAQYKGQARVVGGGTDLILEMQQGHRPAVEALVDVTQIGELNRITLEDDYPVIGAGVTHTQIVNDERVARYGTCLVESCGVIGGPQVRNVGTLAGNVAHALPAGDGTISLLALGGELQVAAAGGLAWIPMENTFLGPGQSSVDPTQAMIARLRFPLTRMGEGSAFRRVMRPQGVALPMIGMAARIKLDESARIAAARVALGPAGPTPFLAEKTMAYLIGQPATPETFAQAAEIMLEEARLRASRHRATAEYRAEMIRSQLPKTLAKAAERARTGQAIPEGVGL